MRSNATNSVELCCVVCDPKQGSNQNLSNEDGRILDVEKEEKETTFQHAMHPSISFRAPAFQHAMHPSISLYAPEPPVTMEGEILVPEAICASQAQLETTSFETEKSTETEIGDSINDIDALDEDDEDDNEIGPC